MCEYASMHGLEENMKCSPLSLSTFSFRARFLPKSKVLAWGWAGSQKILVFLLPLPLLHCSYRLVGRPCLACYRSAGIKLRSSWLCKRHSDPLIHLSGSLLCPFRVSTFVILQVHFFFARFLLLLYFLNFNIPAHSSKSLLAVFKHSALLQSEHSLF